MNIGKKLGPVAAVCLSLLLCLSGVAAEERDRVFELHGDTLTARGEEGIQWVVTPVNGDGMMVPLSEETRDGIRTAAWKLSRETAEETPLLLAAAEREDGSAELMLFAPDEQGALICLSLTLVRDRVTAEWGPGYGPEGTDALRVSLPGDLFRESHGFMGRWTRRRYPPLRQRGKAGKRCSCSCRKRARRAASCLSVCPLPKTRKLPGRSPCAFSSARADSRKSFLWTRADKHRADG